MIDGFHLLRPDLLWALLACPLVALALWYRRVHQGDWTKVIDAELLPYLLPDQRGKAPLAHLDTDPSAGTRDAGRSRTESAARGAAGDQTGRCAGNRPGSQRLDVSR